MTTKRILVLDEDALVMVADKNITHQVDENRGEMTRSEFVNFLIQSQLRESSQNYVNRDEFYHFVQEMKTIMRNLLDFFLSWNLEQEDQQQNKDFNEWLQKIESLNLPDDETSGENHQ